MEECGSEVKCLLHSPIKVQTRFGREENKIKGAIWKLSAEVLR